MHKLMFKFLPFLALFAGLFFTTVVSADSSFSWISSNLSFQKGSDTTSTPSSLNGNIDCQVQNASICSVPATYGAATSNSTLRLNADIFNNGNFLPLYNNIENRQRVIPIPNSNSIISYTTEPSYGFYLYFNYNLSSSVSRTTVFGSDQYKIIKAPDGKLTDKANHRLAADYGSMNFSQNGQWMVVSMPNVAILRVNLQTFEALPFASGFNYTIGLDPAIKTAISNDGRFVAVSSNGFSSFKFYDLSTCTAVPDTINGPVACQSRDLKTYLTQQLPGYILSNNLKFISDDVLSDYATYLVGSTRKTAKVLIGSNGGISNQLDLLGMGESYISGEGAFDYQGGTDTSDNKCHLSLISYPYLAGHDLNYYSYHSIACSGALTDDITNNSDSYTGQVQDRKNQRKNRSVLEIDSTFASFNPGYINQSDFVSRYQPKTILLSVGGNDIGFSKIVTKCGVPWELTTCYSSYEDRVELVRQINNQLFQKLVQTYQTIKNSGASDARIYIVGYPQIAKPDGNCAFNVHLREAEITFSQQLISYLDSVIKLAASKAGVFYVDTQDALNGHRLCEAKNSSVAVNGLTLGNDNPTFIGPIGNESYHPNDLGHQLLENKVLAATHNLTDPMPAANLNAAPPSENGLEILNVPHSGRVVYKMQYDSTLSDDALIAQTSTTISIDGATYSLKPSASYRVELHSDPLVLGSFNTDASGNLNARIQIPADAAPGSHTLHIYGTNLANSSIDIYKTVYVGASSADYDGDGIPNSSDSCQFIVPSNQDYDQDGVDDACDGNITDPPPPAVPSNISSPSTSPDQTPQPSVSLPPSSENTPVLVVAPPPAQSQTPETQTTSSPLAISQVVASENISGGGGRDYFASYYSLPGPINNTRTVVPTKAGKVLAAQTSVKDGKSDSPVKTMAAIVGGLIVAFGVIFARKIGL